MTSEALGGQFAVAIHYPVNERRGRGVQRELPQRWPSYIACGKLSSTVLLIDKQIWWQGPNSVRIPLGIALAVAWTLRLRRIYADVKNAPKRSPKVRRIEIIVLSVLWSFIAVSVTLLILTRH